MKTTNTFAFTLLIIVLIAASFETAVQGYTEATPFDHGDSRATSLDGKMVFAYDVKETFETEPEGGWVQGCTYLVNWTFRLDYANHDDNDQ